MNKRSLEALVKCGALDSTGASRMGMLALLEQALAWGQKHAADRLAGQASIFDMGDTEESSAPRHHPAIPTGEFEKPELLKLEKETLGLYVSEHPLHAVRDQLRRKTDCTLNEMERRRDGEVVSVGGIVSSVKQLTTKKGEPMVFLTLDDPTGGGEVVVFNSTYAQARELCVADRILVIKGRVDHKQQGETKLIAIEVNGFEAVQERTEIKFKLDARAARAGLIRDLAHLVKDYPGPVARARRARHLDGAEDAGARPRLHGRDRHGLPHRGAHAPRRRRDRLSPNEIPFAPHRSGRYSAREARALPGGRGRGAGTPVRVGGGRRAGAPRRDHRQRRRRTTGSPPTSSRGSRSSASRCSACT